MLYGSVQWYVAHHAALNVPYLPVTCLWVLCGRAMDARVIGEFGGGVVAVLGTVGGLGRFLYNRFKKSGFREVEPFARYITQGLKYYAGRYLRHQLAAEFTLRQYARL